MRQLMGAAAAATLALALAAPAEAKLLTVREAMSGTYYELKCWQGRKFLRVRDVQPVRIDASAWQVRRDDGRMFYVSAAQSLCTLDQQRWVVSP